MKKMVIYSESPFTVFIRFALSHSLKQTTFHVAALPCSCFAIIGGVRQGFVFPFTFSSAFARKEPWK